MKITINLPNTEREREVFLKSFEKNGISKQMANSLELLLHQKSFPNRNFGSQQLQR